MLTSFVPCWAHIHHTFQVERVTDYRVSYPARPYLFHTPCIRAIVGCGRVEQVVRRDHAASDKYELVDWSY